MKTITLQLLAIYTFSLSAFASQSALEIKYDFGNKTETQIQVTDTLSEDEESTPATITLKNREIGKILSGKYKDGALILAYYTDKSSTPCYPPSACVNNGLMRFIKLNNKMIFLKNSSMVPPWFMSKKEVHFQDFQKLTHEKFKSLGFELIIDEQFKIPGIYLEKEIIFDANQRKKIIFVTNSTNFDFDLYETIQNKNITEKFYALKKDKFQDVFVLNYDFVNTIGSASKNTFAITNTDETYSYYAYIPDIYSKSEIDPSIYTHMAQDCGFERPFNLLDLIQPPDKSEDKLTIYKKLSNGDTVYLATEKMLQELYSSYIKTKGEMVSLSAHSMVNRRYSGEINEPQDFLSFKKQNPMLIWKNPFGKWTGFILYRFMKNNFCE